MKFKHMIHTLDYHHGQASRTIIAGYPPILGATMAEKADYYDRNLSWIHKSLIREPRGHANMLGSILTEPVSPDSAFGVLFLHANGQFDMCGDSAFATAFALLENGMVDPVEPLTTFNLDTPAGKVAIKAYIKGTTVTSVSINNVPSHYICDRSVTLASGPKLTLEIAYGGLTYALVDSGQIDIPLAPENSSQLIRLGMEVIKQANAECPATGMSSEKKTIIDLATFYEKQNHSQNHYRVCNIYPPGRMGRTPSGTGMSAHMALRCHKGDLELNQEFVQESILGTLFTGRIFGQETTETKIAYMPEISTKSYLMGIHQFIIDPDDPFKEGFEIGSANV